MPFEGEETYRLQESSYLGALFSAYYIIGKNQTPRDLENIEARYRKQSQALGWKFNRIV